jgi:hypothetical protein
MKQRHALRADKEALTRLFRKNPNAEIPKNLRGFHENIYNECMKFADTAEMREPCGRHFADFGSVETQLRKFVKNYVVQRDTSPETMFAGNRSNAY